jgi:peptidoglycan/xylan/chitin deacetylase (PgdA/CDA1 family)
MQQFPWPDGKKAAVALTFDMDGETIPYVVDPDNAPRRLSLMSEMAYGPNVGIHRILDLLDLYEIRASVFVPGRTAELHPDVVKEIVARGHDIGHHGYMHERPDGLSDEVERKVLERGIEVLTSITGKAPTGYRSPAAELKPTSPALLVEHGFAWDTTLMGADHPYIVPTERGDLIELPMYWHNDDWPLFGFVSVPAVGNGISPPSAVFEVWSEQFEGLYERGGLFNLCMHPFLSGRPAGLRILERLIRFMRGFPQVWWAPLSEIAEHCAKDDVRSRLMRHEPVIPEARWITE